jgi:hypothetical protein
MLIEMCRCCTRLNCNTKTTSEFAEINHVLYCSDCGVLGETLCSVVCGY